MMAVAIPPSLCPACGVGIDQADDLFGQPTGAGPQPGDLSMCECCGELTCFNLLLSSVPVSDAKRRRMIREDPVRCLAMLRQCFAVRRAYGKRAR